MRVLLLTPPMVQLNTPYPATAYLTGFLRQHAAEFDLDIQQADPALELFLAIFCRAGLTRVRAALPKRVGSSKGARPPAPRSVASFVAQAARYLETIDPVIRFLQGRDPALAERIAGRGYLPEGPRFEALLDALGAGDGPGAGEPDEVDGDAHPLAQAFTALSLADRAKHRASLSDFGQKCQPLDGAMRQRLAPAHLAGAGPSQGEEAAGARAPGAVVVAAGGPGATGGESGTTDGESGATGGRATHGS